MLWICSQKGGALEVWVFSTYLHPFDELLLQGLLSPLSKAHDWEELIPAAPR